MVAAKAGSLVACLVVLMAEQKVGWRVAWWGAPMAASKVALLAESMAGLKAATKVAQMAE